MNRTRQERKAYIKPLSQDGSFRTRFRMEPKEFNRLYRMLRGRLECDASKGRGRNGTITGEWALASTLQWLAGHGVTSAADGPRMATSTACAKIKGGLDAINDWGRLRIKWPRTERDLRRVARAQQDPVLKKCVGALDGVLVRRKKRSINEHPCPDMFFSGHKMTVGINYQVNMV